MPARWHPVQSVPRAEATFPDAGASGGLLIPEGKAALPAKPIHEI